MGENPLNGNGVHPNVKSRMKIWSVQLGNLVGLYRFIFFDMKKFDKEYSTQYTPEMVYLKNNGVSPTFVKSENGVTTYKYKKTSNLFRLLAIFYASYD